MLYLRRLMSITALIALCVYPPSTLGAQRSSAIHIVFVSEMSGNFGVYYTDGIRVDPYPLFVPPAARDNVTSAACSPDGTKIAMNLYGGQIAIMDLATAALTELPLERNRYDNLVWSPDGERLAFTRGVSGDVFTLDLAAFELQQINTVRGRSDFPTWSPTGDQLAFTNADDGEYTIYVKDMTTFSPETRLLTNTATPYWALSWSPTAAEIAYDVYVPNSAVYTLALTPNAQPAPLFASANHSYGAAHWSPDGQRLAFTFTVDGTAELYVAHRDGTNRRLLTDNGQAWDEAQCWLSTSPPIAALD